MSPLPRTLERSTGFSTPRESSGAAIESDNPDSSAAHWAWHFLFRVERKLWLARKEPREKIHGGYGHAYTEEHAGQNAFAASLAKGEGQASHYNRYERQAASDGAGKSLLQHVDGIFPR